MSAVAFKFHARHLRLISPFVAKGDIRHYLNGFCVQRAGRHGGVGVYIIGSDGHRFGLVYDPEGEISGVDSVICRLTPQMLLAAKDKSATRGRMVPGTGWVELADDRLRITEAPGEVAPSDAERFVLPGKAVIDGTYPDWQKVTPNLRKVRPGLAAAVNARYLADYTKLITPRLEAVTFWQNPEAGPDSAVLVQVPAAPEFMGVLMPMRHTHALEPLLRVLPPSESVQVQRPTATAEAVPA